MRLEAWDAYEPGWATAILDGLDSSEVVSLRLPNQGPALDEVIERITTLEWPALETLELPECRDEHLDALASAFGGKVRALSLHTSGLTDEGGVRLLDDLGGPRLESLTFGREPRSVGAAWARAIAGSPALRRLEARLARGALAAFCGDAASTKLESLRTSYESEVDASDFASLAAWPGSQALRELSCASGARIDDEALAALAGSDHLGGLEQVELRLCAFGAAGAQAWSERVPPGLRVLAIDQVELGDAGARLLVDSAPPSLEKLMLPGCGVGDETSVAIAGAAPRLTKLVEVDLSHGRVGLEGLSAIVESSIGPQLEGLHLESGLESPKVGSEGLAWIAERVEDLRRLSLAGQDVGYDALLQALQCSGLQRLEELDVRNNDELFDADTLLWDIEDLGLHVHALRAGDER